MRAIWGGWGASVPQRAVCEWDGKRGRSNGGMRAWGVTNAVGQVFDQVINLDLAGLELAVEPAAVRLAAWYTARRGSGDAHHLVNVFCWTLTHCCSSGAMLEAVHRGCSCTAQETGRVR